MNDMQRPLCYPYFVCVCILGCFVLSSVSFFLLFGIENFILNINLHNNDSYHHHHRHREYRLYLVYSASLSQQYFISQYFRLFL